MTPDHLDHVEFSDHAEDKLDELGVERSFIYGRIMYGHGNFYKDTQEGGYNMHIIDKDLVLALSVHYVRNQKTAVVKTVFESHNPRSRFSAPRFEPHP